MLGQGTQFLDFNLGNKYCSSSLDMAIKWIHVNGDDSKIISPLKDRAACLLEKNIIPVYVLSAKDTLITPGKAGQIAKSLSGAGPVVITTQINFDAFGTKTKDDAIEVIKDQIRKIDENCPECLIAVTPKMGDEEALTAILSDITLSTKVDFIAFGVDSRFSRTCDAAKLLGDATQFSQYGLSTYGKPSIWVYMMVENKGKNRDGTCIWDPNEQPRLFNSIFSTDLPVLVKNGVVGISPYAYYDVDNPLGCKDCTLSSPTMADSIKNFDFKPNEPYFSHWYWFCKEYVTPGEDVNTQTGKMLSVFPPETENSLGCLFLEENNAWYFKYAFLNNKYGVSNSIDHSSPKTFDTQPEELKATCEVCAVKEKDNFPEGLADEDGITVIATSPNAGTAYPVIDFYADKFDLDSLLLRANIDAESGFNPCAASVVTNGKDNCYKSDLNSVPDPELSFNNCNIQPLPQDKSYCAFGLGQVRTAPSEMWEQLKGKVAGQYYDSDNALKTLCSENFNPYDPANASCASAYHLRVGWDNAESIVNSNYQSLNLDSPDSELAGWYKSYLALYLYGGPGTSTAQSMINNYAALKDGGTCTVSEKLVKFNDAGDPVEVNAPAEYKPKDFLDYMHRCQSETVAYDKLRKYHYLLNNQPNTCEN
ncbi:hypothetical protein HZC08_01210 [Candidatus Micrarchaeota archaeon]|nr:hypothetical protein [Candidatus Micrarchaeota archaeon]